PGVDAYSSWPAASPNRRLSGTSNSRHPRGGNCRAMAQATGATGAALWGQLVRTAQRLPIPAVDAGAGLVQAPQF
ncbi:MAG: protease, partial [Pseudonocardiaceae bacterium]